MPALRIPRVLAAAVDEDAPRYPSRPRWLAALPGVTAELATRWNLELGEPYEPGGQCSWTAPARGPQGDRLALKVEWRHSEAEHEAEALRLWDGDGAVRCLDACKRGDTIALLLERCEPGVQLKASRSEPEQDIVIAGLMRRLWSHRPPGGDPFRSLQKICDDWAEQLELEFADSDHGLDPALAREGLALLRELPRTADRSVLLATDLHAENVLSSQREPWLAIDPKPFIGDPAYDPAQHMLNCEKRLAIDPVSLSRRMANLLELDPERVRLWLFTRCVQESPHYPSLRATARCLAP